MKEIIFLVDYHGKVKGQTYSFTEDVCELFIKIGVAEYPTEKKSKK
jgi:hypothetical protein